MSERELDEYMIFIMKLSCDKFEGEPYTWYLVSEYGVDEHFYCPNCDAERNHIGDAARDEHHDVEHLGYVTLRDIMKVLRKDD